MIRMHSEVVLSLAIVMWLRKKKRYAPLCMIVCVGAGIAAANTDCCFNGEFCCNCRSHSARALATAASATLRSCSLCCAISIRRKNRQPYLNFYKHFNWAQFEKLITVLSLFSWWKWKFMSFFKQISSIDYINTLKSPNYNFEVIFTIKGKKKHTNLWYAIPSNDRQLLLKHQ